MLRKRIFILKAFYRFLIILALVFFSSDYCGAVEILNVRHWTAPDHTRIVLDIDGKPDYQAKESEHWLVLSVKKSSLNKTLPQNVFINKPGIKKISFFKTPEGNIQIKFFLDKHQRVDVFKLNKFQNRPDRIVVDISLKEAPKTSKAKEKISETQKEIIIVIDPGHGGDDPGAIGKKGSYEKNIVLAVSREIRTAINEMPGYRAVLTRDGDYYVSFKKRLQKARDLNAGLFISVHADAARNRSAKGSSVYCLSTGAASNEAARLLAHNENLSDIFGGETDIESNNESNPIIMNMFQTNTINLSKIYAETLIKHLNMVNCLKYEIVQEAPFRVLKLPEIPAVLIETAYISNAEEENLLKKTNFQKKLATAISASVKDYFAINGKEPQREEDIAATEYKIKKGDTLFAVAKKFNTRIDVLLKLNNMKLEDTIFVGQDIMVPADETATEDQDKNRSKKKKTSGKTDKVGESEKPVRLYTVKKGETLFIVAKKHSVTLASLLKTNKMKITDKLLSGQKIKIPQE